MPSRKKRVTNHLSGEQKLEDTAAGERTSHSPENLGSRRKERQNPRSLNTVGDSIPLPKAHFSEDALVLEELPSASQAESVMKPSPTSEKAERPGTARAKRVSRPIEDIDREVSNEERSCDSPDPLDAVSSFSKGFVPSSHDDSSANEELSSCSKRKKTRKYLDGLTKKRSPISERNRKKGSSSTPEMSAFSNPSLGNEDDLFFESEDDEADMEQGVSRLSDSTKEILEKLVKNIQCDFEPTKSQIDKLQLLDIRLKNVPPNHFLSRGSGRQDIENPELLKKDAFTDDEVYTISQNWEKFCKEYGLHSVKDLNLFFPNPFTEGKKKLSREQRRKFCQYISQGLPDRHPTSVYRRFLNIYLFDKTGRWSSEEEDLLLSWYDSMPSEIIYSYVGRILRRRKQSCYKKLLKLRPELQYDDENMKDRSNHGYPSWTKDENAWKRIAEKGPLDVGTVKKVYFLNLYPTLELSESPAERARQQELLHRAVVRELIMSGATDWNTVDWVALGSHPRDIGAVAAYAIVRKLTKTHVHPDNWSNLEACLNVLKSALRIRKRNSRDYKEEEDGKKKPKKTPKMARKMKTSHSDEEMEDSEKANKKPPGKPKKEKMKFEINL